MDHSDLQELLEERMRIIEDAEMREHAPEKQLALLQDVSERIDAWRNQHRTTMDRQLLHYLQQSSLSKALDFVKALPSE